MKQLKDSDVYLGQGSDSRKHAHGEQAKFLLEIVLRCAKDPRIKFFDEKH